MWEGGQGWLNVKIGHLLTENSKQIIYGRALIFIERQEWWEKNYKITSSLGVVT